jgi:mxaJ protein
MRTAIAFLMLAAAALVGQASDLSTAGRHPLRVCADPNNLPFSNQRGEGFENRLAEMLGRELNAKVEYVWWAERKQLVKQTLEAGRCDVLAGVPAGLEGVLATEPYYRSSYVLVSRRDRGYNLRSLNDPRLRTLRIGIHVVGNDYAPPAYLLARRGVVNNIVPFSLFGSYGEENPPARLIEAAARGEVDLAIAWGPLAGYFAAHQPVAMEVVPLAGPASIPLAYAMTLGVRPQDAALRDELNRALAAEKEEIARLLANYGVPVVQP